MSGIFSSPQGGCGAANFAVSESSGAPPLVELNEIVSSDTGRQPSGAALPCEGELSRLRSGGTPASLER